MTNVPPHPPRRRSLSLAALVAVAAALGTACDVTSATEDPSPETTLMAARDLDEPSPAVRAPRPPSVPGVDDPVSEPVAVAADLLASSAAAGPGTPEIDRLALSDDLRMAWVLVDALAVAPADRVSDVVRGLATLTGQALPPGEPPALFYGDLLLGWEVPAPPGYPEDKTLLLAGATPDGVVTLDAALPLDWRHVTRAGLGPDDAVLDPPEVGVAGEAGGWLGDDEVVVALEVGGEARAYPARVLAAHEVINDLVGGRPIAVVHCGPCGATVAFARDTDRAEGMLADDGAPVVLDTTGLAERGAPLLADRRSGLVVRPLAGEAVAPGGARPLATLAVRTTTWGAWRAAFPATTVVSNDAGIGRVYVSASAPATVRTWPVGPVDPRVPAGEVVLGVVDGPDGPVAFPADDAMTRLRAGDVVEADGVRLVLDAGGLAAVSTTGAPVPAHLANWLTWTGFHPTTSLWTP